ncbi:hypothetical protein M422DRAFT_258916 [Sphaerobolus stellatus SS14]|uniref:Uncharacterized protein n=1 Tax=Sphaerobolus stellatus (strain SS14) TaxID=990650 RepID=A0A0C9UUJ5_SPHS4|nr:hypothetical protein M422DRAFT_258916 [Sphaerobolus stellatus SS14]
MPYRHTISNEQLAPFLEAAKLMTIPEDDVPPLVVEAIPEPYASQNETILAMHQALIAEAIKTNTNNKKADEEEAKRKVEEAAAAKAAEEENEHAIDANSEGEDEVDKDETPKSKSKKTKSHSIVDSESEEETEEVKAKRRKAKGKGKAEGWDQEEGSGQREGFGKQREGFGKYTEDHLQGSKRKVVSEEDDIVVEPRPKRARTAANSTGSNERIPSVAESLHGINQALIQTVTLLGDNQAANEHQAKYLHGIETCMANLQFTMQTHVQQVHSRLGELERRAGIWPMENEEYADEEVVPAEPDDMEEEVKEVHEEVEEIREEVKEGREVEDDETMKDPEADEL